MQTLKLYVDKSMLDPVSGQYRITLPIPRGLIRVLSGTTLMNVSPLPGDPNVAFSVGGNIPGVGANMIIPGDAVSIGSATFGAVEAVAAEFSDPDPFLLFAMLPVDLAAYTGGFAVQVAIAYEQV